MPDYKIGVGRAAYPLLWRSIGQRHLELPAKLPEEVLVTPAMAKQYRYVCMTIMHPLIEDNQTYIVYRNAGEVCLAQPFKDQDERLLPEVSG